jgi:hypothetical protein
MYYLVVYVSGTPSPPSLLAASEAAALGGSLRRIRAPHRMQPRRVRRDGSAKRLHLPVHPTTSDLPRRRDV